MKKLLYLIVLLPSISLTLAQAPDSWNQKADFAGMGREYAVSFSIGTKGYIGTGLNHNHGLRKDFWEYDPSTDAWTQRADFGSTARYGAIGMSIGEKGYIGLGFDGGYPTDFWEYDPSNNTWTQKAGFAGSSRESASAFSIGSKGYVGMGIDFIGVAYRNDFWEYDPAADSWTKKADFGGVPREGAVGFSIETKGYIVTGYSGMFGNNKYPTDFWEYDPSTNYWTQKADFPGSGRHWGIGFSIGTSGYVGTGYGQYEIHNDFWEYRRDLDSWEQKGDYDRCYASTAFSIGEKGYIGTGNYISPDDVTFFEYTPCQANVVSQPATQIECAGDAVTFSAGFTGDSLTYQWRKNYVEIPGATNSSYTIVSASSNDIGNYDAVATNGCTTVWTNSASLSLHLAGVWIGGISSDWNDAGNWCGIPDTGTTVTISGDTPFQPDLSSGDAFAKDIIVENGAALTVNGGALHLQGSIFNSGTITASSGDIYSKDITVDSDAILDVNGGTIHLKGNIFNAGTISNSTGTFSFEGTTMQTIPSLTLQNADVNNEDGINITGDLVINGSLSLTNGIITTDSNKVIVADQATLSRANGWVNGNLQKHLSAGNNVAKSFEVGDATDYTPVDLILHESSDADVMIYTTAGDHPFIASSPINPSTSVNRVWQISGLLAYTVFDATFHFDESDLDVGANPNSFSVAKYDGAQWTTLTTGIRTAASTQAVNVISGGQFIIGCAVPIVLSDPLPEAKCEGDAVTFEASIAGSDLTYQWRKNTINIPGATNTSYTIPSVVPDNGGTYDLVVSNGCNTVTSNGATLIVHSSGTWIGTTNSDWNDASNWCGGVPNATTNVTIISDTPFQPELSSGDGYANNITVGNGALLTVSGGTLHIDGNIINDGAITNSDGTFLFEGTSLQTIPSLTLQNAEINNQAGINIIGDLVINESLSLIQGTVTTDINKVIITHSANISRDGGWVNGNLQKSVSPGENISRSFEIGDEARYAPIDLIIHGATEENVIAYTSAGDHPLITSSAIDPSKSVNRVWHLSGSTNFATFDATFNFNDDDLDSGANPNNFLVAKYDDTSWTTLTTGIRTDTNTQALNNTSALDFIVGEENLTPTQDTWIQRDNVGGMARFNATGFSIGTKGYIGTGIDANGNLCKDFWEYDPSTNTWTQKADFGGTPRNLAIGFSIGAKGYIGTGYDGGLTGDFWEYDPASNSWTQKADFGGSARQASVGFSIGAKGYLGTGIDGGGLRKDFWEYDPSTDLWTQKSDFGGVIRYLATGFSIGTKGYIGTGWSIFIPRARKDFWEYDPATDTWIQKADFGGMARYSASGFSIDGAGYIGTGFSLTSNNYCKDFWEYNSTVNSWTQRSDFGGVARDGATAFSIGTKGYIGTGTNGTAHRDFWEYTPICTQYTFYSDADSDGYGNPNSTIQACIAPNGYVPDSSDCNDAEMNVHPGASEVCNNIDDNCNDQIDEGVKTTFYADADHDGYGNAGATVQTCSTTIGYVSNSTDCNDANASVHPGAIDVCNNIDDNCNGMTDENQVTGVSATGNSPICSAQTLTLNSTSDNGATYSWNGPNGFSSSEQNPSIMNVTPSTSGTYTVTVTNAFVGCEATGTVSVIVNPTVNAGASSNSPVCSGATLNLSASGGASYMWSGQVAFTSSLQNPTISNVNSAASGIYNVMVTTASGCSATASVSVTINSATTITTQPVNLAGCTGSSITFSVNASGVNLAYQWQKKANGNNYNNISGATNSNFTINNLATSNAGIYRVIVSGACSNVTSSTASLIVNVAPTSTASSNSPVCAGSILNLYSSMGSSYSWTGSNGFTSTHRNPNITNATTAASGTYTVTITNSSGCSASASTSVTVNPTTAITTQPVSQTVCSGNSVTFSVIASGTSLTYQWKKGTSSITGATNAIYTIASTTAGDAGSYKVIVSGTCGSAVTSNSVSLTVSDCSCTNATNLTTTNITSMSATLNWTTSVDPQQWQIQYKKSGNGRWTDILLSGSARSTSVTGLQKNTSYVLHIRAKCNGTWTSYSSNQTFTTLAAKENDQITFSSETKLALYPNPTSGKFMVSLEFADDVNSEADVEIMNSLGQIIHFDRATIVNGELLDEVTLQGIVPGGNYFVRVIVADQVFTGQIIIQQ